jgi:hypothetical protein
MVLTKTEECNFVEGQEPEEAVLVTGMVGGVLAVEGADNGNIARDIIGPDPNDEE